MRIIDWISRLVISGLLFETIARMSDLKWIARAKLLIEY